MASGSSGRSSSSSVSLTKALLIRSLSPGPTQQDLGPDRKLSNRLLIELDMGLQPTLHTIYCGGDRYRTHSRAVFSGGALARRTGPSSGRGGPGVRRGLWRDCGGREGD